MLFEVELDVLFIETKTTSVIKILEDNTNTENFLIVATHCHKNRLQIKVHGCNWVIREIIRRENEEESELIHGMYQYQMKKPKKWFSLISVKGENHTDVIFDFQVKPELIYLKCDGCNVTFSKLLIFDTLAIKISNGSSLDMNNSSCYNMCLVMENGVIKNANVLNKLYFNTPMDGILYNVYVHPNAEVEENGQANKRKQWILGMV